MTLGQRRLLYKGITGLRQDSGTGLGADSISPDPVNTKSLAKHGGLEEILNKMERIGALDDSLLAPGATESFMGQRLDNDPQVFWGAATKATNVGKGGEKPLLIPDFVSFNSFTSSDDEHEFGNSGGASIVIRASNTKVKLENITLSM